MFGYFTLNASSSSVRSLSSAGVEVHPLNRIVPEAPALLVLLPPQAVSSTADIAASAKPSRIERMLPLPLFPVLSYAHVSLPKTEIYIAFTVAHLLSTSATHCWKSLGPN